MLLLIADGAVGANAEHSLAGFEGTVAGETETGVDQSIRAEAEIEVGLRRLEGEFDDGAGGAELIGRDADGPRADPGER